LRLYEYLQRIHVHKINFDYTPVCLATKCTTTLNNNMNKPYIEDKIFERTDFAENALIKADYEHCIFVNCNLLNADLSDINFSECKFNGCDISLANISRTALRNIKFKDCKLLGLHFENCNPFLFTVDFENCILNLSSFYKLKLKKTKFKSSSLQEVDFAETDLSSSLFDNCDLAGATFDNTVLERVDFRTSYNYSIDLEKNRIKKAKFAMAGIAGLLNKYDIEIEN